MFYFQFPFTELPNYSFDCGQSDWLLVEQLRQQIKKISINGVTATVSRIESIQSRQMECSLTVFVLKGRVEFGSNGERKYARTKVFVKQYQTLEVNCLKWLEKNDDT